MQILYIISALLVLVVAVVLLRTVLLKPTSARNAKVELDYGPRAEKYGKQLSALVQKETISSRFDSDRTKFLEFHELLKEMFPNVHKTCEKHVFNGSLLNSRSKRSV